MVLSKVQSLFCLADSANEKRIRFSIESNFCFLKESDCCLNFGVLSAHTHSDNCVLKWVKLFVEGFDKFIIQLNQVLVYGLLEYSWLSVRNKVVSNLMPHPNLNYSLETYFSVYWSVITVISSAS